MKEVIIFAISPYTGDYVSKEASLHPVSDEMLALEEFLGTDVRGGSWNVIKDLIDCQRDHFCKGFGMNVTDLTKLSNEKIALNYGVLDNLKDLIISFEDLIDIVTKWGELRTQRVPYIIIECEGEKYSIRGSDSFELINIAEKIT